MHLHLTNADKFLDIGGWCREEKLKNCYLKCAGIMGEDFVVQKIFKVLSPCAGNKLENDINTE